MRGPSSLSNRIFLACTVLSTLSLGFAFYYVNARASVEARMTIRNMKVITSSQTSAEESG